MHGSLCRRLFGAACLLLAVGVAGAAEQIVLESNTSSYAVGQTLDAGSVIVLRRDELVIIATEDGRILRVVGPHEGPAAGDPPSENAVREALARLLGPGRLEAGGIAGVRGGTDEELAADARTAPWLIHAEHNGDQCFVRNSALRLWREDANDGAHYEIVDLASARTARIEWAGAEREVDWPVALAPADARVYLVRADGELRSVAIRLHALEPAVADSGLASVVWLAAKGCTNQARLLLDRIGSSDGA